VRGPVVTADRKDRACAFIRDVVADRGYPPSVRELQAHLAIPSLGSVHKLLAALQADGRITRTPGTARGLTLVEAS
jgi:repressor LexA